jgi:hypothetical protein
VTPHWSWGLSTALVLTLVIFLNGRQVRVGWLLGAAVQLINLGFGYFVYGQSTFLFLAFPAAMFLVNWWKHPRRVKPRPLKDLTEIEPSIVWSRSCSSVSPQGHACDRTDVSHSLHPEVHWAAIDLYGDNPRVTTWTTIEESAIAVLDQPSKPDPE